MKAELPTEEDVLAFLVVSAARPIQTNAYATAQLLEQSAWRELVETRPGEFWNAVAVLAFRRVSAAASYEAAIADSERRLAVERAERAVLDAAKIYHDARCNWANGVDGPDIEEAADAVDDAASAMEDARVMAGVYDAEVSRHGG